LVLFVVVDFLFRRGLAGGRVSKKNDFLINKQTKQKKVKEFFVFSAIIK